MKRLFGNTNNIAISAIKNPFLKNCIESIDIQMYKRFYTGEFKFCAIIEFKNNNTKASHRIDDYEDLADAFLKAQAFVETLK